jgi:hypothetical protein
MSIYLVAGLILLGVFAVGFGVGFVIGKLGKKN